MTLNVVLSPEEAAKLLAQAQARGMSPDALVREVLKSILAEPHSSAKRPTRSSYGALAKYGPAPSAEDIDENRREILCNFARDDDEW